MNRNQSEPSKNRSNSRPPALTYAVALLATVIAGLTRWLVDPLLGDHLPYATFFIAIIFVTWYAGFRPAMLVLVLGFFVTLYFFVPPRNTFFGATGPHLVGLAMYWIVGFAIAAFGESMRLAQRRYEELAQQHEPAFLERVSATTFQHSLRDVTYIGFVLMLLVLIIGGIVGYINVRRLVENDRMVAHTHQVMAAFESLESDLLLAETGMRGYLLTEDMTYLGNFDATLKQSQSDFDLVKKLTSDNPDQQTALAVLETKIDQKRAVMSRTMDLMKGGDQPQAVELVRSNKGQELMHDVRKGLLSMQAAEQQLLTLRSAESEASSNLTVLSIAFASLLGMMLVGVVFSISRRNELQKQHAATILTAQAERLRVTLASIGDGVITTDEKGQVNDLNPVAEQLTGWTKATAMGQPIKAIFQIVNEDTRQPVESPVTRALKEGAVVGLANHTILIAKNGTEWFIDDSAAPIRSKEGEVVGCVLVFRDISERRRLEHQVVDQLSAARFLATIVDSSQDAIVSKTLDGTIQSWNAGAQRLFRYTAEQAVGRHISLIIPNDRAAEEEQIITRLKAGERIEHFETVRLRSDGQPVHISLTVSPIKDETGKIVGASKIARDITERKNFEQELIRREKELADFFDNATLGLHWVGLDGIILRANRHELNMLGYSADEYIGHPIAEFHADQDVIGDILSRLQAGEELSDYTAQLRCKDGSLRDVLINSNVMWDNGQFVHTRCFTRDVTELKRTNDALRLSESRFRAAIEASNSLIWTNNSEGQMAGEQPEWSNFTGQKNEEYQGYGWAKAVHPDDAEATIVAWNQAVQERKMFVFQHRVRRRDGEWRLCSIRAIPVLNEAGDIREWVGMHTDITDVMQAAERERQLLADSATANAKFQAFFDQGAIFASIVNLDGLVVDCNRLFDEGCGFTPQQCIGKPFWEGPWWALSPLLVDKIKAACAQAAAGIMFQGEVPYFVADGSQRTADLIIAPVKDETGKVLFLSPTGIDITDRKQIEIALRESERRIRMATEATGVGIWEWNVIAGQIRWDAHMFRIYGIPPTPNGFLPYATWIATVFPDERPQQDELLQETVRRIGTSSREFHIRRVNDGSTRLIQSVETVRTNAEGRAEWVLGTNLDITEQREAEEVLKTTQSRLALGVEVAGLALAEVDYVTGLIHLTDEAARLFGLGDVARSIPREMVHATFHADDRAELKRRIAEVMDPAGTGWFTMDHRVVWPNNEVRWLHVSERVMFAGKGPARRPERSIIAALDATHTKQIEEKLRRLAADLSEADHRKDEFLATLAHELRNPLAPIRNGLEILRMSGKGGPIVAQARNMMERQIAQMVHLVDDLLDVSRITRGKLELRRGRIELAKILNNAVETSRPIIEASGHTLMINLPNEPLYVDADETRLGQVFANLLNNAAKYSERGGAIIFTAKRQGSEAVVSVQDSGIGIPHDMLPKIFEIFTQVDRSLEKSQGGLGIGLTLVKRLVELHGGTVEARSEGPGQGSLFIIRLPTVSDEPLPARTGTTVRTPHHYKILVADDNVDSAESLAMMLEIMGHEVRAVHDGVQAVELAPEFQPDVIILDIGMPNLNGYEACRRIRNQSSSKSTTLVALTGWGQDEDKRRSHEAGFDHHLVKPVDLAELEKIFASLPKSE